MEDHDVLIVPFLTFPKRQCILVPVSCNGDNELMT